MAEFKEKINSFEIIKTNEWPEYDLKVTLKPCFRCNHKCWFCEEYNNNTKTWTKEQCDQVLEKIKQLKHELNNVSTKELTKIKSDIMQKSPIQCLEG